MDFYFIGDLAFFARQGKRNIGARPLFIEYMDLATVAQYEIGAEKEPDTETFNMTVTI